MRKPCAKCKIEERRKDRNWCNTCSNESARAYKARNIDAVREKRRAYYQENREEILAFLKRKRRILKDE